MTEWVVTFEPEKAIIDVDRSRAARQRLKKTRQKKNPENSQSRNQLKATTLFSGTLFCGYCGRELLLYRSAQNYKNMFCDRGKTAKHGCELCTSKSTRVIENCLLGFLKESVLTEEAVTDLVTKANSHLKALASKPRVDVAPLKSQIASIQKRIDSFVLRVEKLKESEEELREGYERRIIQLQKEVKSLRKELQTAEQANIPVPPPLTKRRVKTYVTDLREVLNQEIPMAAEAIRQLTGPISITQEATPGKKHGARWTATFSPNLLALLRQIVKNKDYPDSMTLEFLSHGIWTTPVEVSAVIEEVPKYELLAPIFLEMEERGTSVQTIAAAHGMCWDQAKMILHFAKTGERPKWPKKKKESKGKGGNREKYLSHCKDVVERRKKGESFAKIALELGISEATVRRAWDHANLDKVIEAAETGTTPNRGSYQDPPADKLREAQALLKEGKLAIREIVAQTGLSPSTVRREQERMKKQ